MAIPIKLFGFLSRDELCQLAYALSTPGEEDPTPPERVPDCHGEQLELPL